MKEIITKYKYGIKTIIKNITGNYNEDLEQEVYIKAWKNQDKYSEQNKFGAWIYKIAQNTCKDFLKSASYKKNKVTSSDDEYLQTVKDYSRSPENEFQRKQRHKMILDAIEALPQKHREVVVLYDMHEMSYEQISQKLGCPVGTVKSRLYNARKELSESLKELL